MVDTVRIQLVEHITIIWIKPASQYDPNRKGKIGENNKERRICI